MNDTATWATMTGRKDTALEVLNEWWGNDDNHDMNLDEWLEAQSMAYLGDDYAPLGDWEAFAMQLATDAASERLNVTTCDAGDADKMLMWLISLAIDGPGRGA